MQLTVEQAFTRFYNIAMEIAGECDCLIESQKEVVQFTTSLRSLLSNLHTVFAEAVPTDTGYTIQVSEQLFLRIMSGMNISHTCVGIESADDSSVKPRSSFPSLGKRHN